MKASIAVGLAILVALLVGASPTNAFEPPGVLVTPHDTNRTGVIVSVERLTYTDRQLAVTVTVSTNTPYLENMQAILYSDLCGMNLAVTIDKDGTRRCSFSMAPTLLAKSQITLLAADTEHWKRTYLIALRQFLGKDLLQEENQRTQPTKDGTGGNLPNEASHAIGADAPQHER